MLKLTCTAVLIVALTGCSDPKQASDKNFKAAIQEYLNTAYPKCYFNEKFPVQIDTDSFGRRAALQSLAKAGLLSETELSRREFKDWNGNVKLIIKSEYALTDTGRKFYNPNARQVMNREIGGFCIGKAKVREINRFTEPADMLGHRITKVNYSYSIDELPEWATMLEVKAAIPGLKEAADSTATPIKETDTLVLTNNGWVHERLFAK
ncbi:hypothetical protein [Noviherbaspirillum malthae]|uniref:hypothetical protein n=1 Tax=Noviherbaspirillum malthae TaxID=1260987 RepID=UPI00188DF704|nr:hypothetical protein [Noviherbaspirillum malthae]